MITPLFNLKRLIIKIFYYNYVAKKYLYYLIFLGKSIAITIFYYAKLIKYR